MRKCCELQWNLGHGFSHIVNRINEILGHGLTNASARRRWHKIIMNQSMVLAFKVNRVAYIVVVGHFFDQ